MRTQSGFTLIEMITAVFIAGVLIVGVIGLYSMLTRAVKAGREQTILASLSSNYLETVRNLPYDSIGTAFGNPAGNLPDETDPIEATIESTLYKIYYEVTYVDDPADGTITDGTDSAANDYKQVKISILNTRTSVVKSFVTTVTPDGLEDTISAGALAIKVFDAVGQPVAGAQVHIENLDSTPQIILDRTTDASGNWTEVGLPASVNGYHISVSKSNFSTDQTYPITADNPNPIKPDSTIVIGEVTQVSFSIDELSTLSIQTLSAACQSLSGVDVNLSGAKLIGTSPDVKKYDNDLTSASGQIELNDLEWDTYTPELLTGQNLMVLGTSPIQQISVLPGSTQTYTMVLGPQTANSLLVIVKDAATGAALEGASVQLSKASPVENYSGITGGSAWTQSDWSGGSGQADFTNPTQYFSDDGNIDTTTLPTGVRLAQVGGNYTASGQFVSSTFDTGAASSFSTLSWEPTSQSPSTTLKFQIATNNDNATWNFVGPDGTSATYYTVSGTDIAPVHDGNRYLRYEAFLGTSDPALTPVLSSLTVNYVAGCFTPGQVSFGSLTAGTDYSLEVSLPGYQTSTLNNLQIIGNQEAEILMNPS